MRILLTGGSSFTGLWLVRELASAGHEVVATLRRKPEDYAEDLRQRRARELIKVCRPAVGVAFGDQGFMELLGEGKWDVVCHHAADVTNYKSRDFDCLGAAGANTRNIAAVFDRLKEIGCPRFVATGSVFENDEGAGSEGLPAFSPYGLSKSITWQMVRFYGQRAGVGVGKFVIPNPFGPWEEPRFTAYLMKNWLAGAAATVNTPEFVRDNIHASLLGACYRRFIESMPAAPGLWKMNPSGYIESQGAFAQRVAAEVRRRTGLACDVVLKTQSEFPEPRIRINTTPAVETAESWSEPAAWDDFVAFYCAR